MYRSKRKGSSCVVLAAASVAVVLVSGQRASAAFDVVEKSIPQLEAAYTSGATTVQDVINQYLNRINTYNGPISNPNSSPYSNGINAVAQINPNLAAAVAQAQALIASGATTSQYPLLGVPVLVKDSYDVVGMTTTNGVSVLNGSGTPGSTTMIAKNDAPSVAALKAAGAIIIAKGTMSTMAYSYDGIDNAHGVVRNPYNFNRQPGGSSSGIGAGTASNFAMFGMGGETGGSIRVPSTYNNLVGLKTSAGVIDPSGTWPLTPTRDVVGPIAKTVTDIAYAMNALVKPTSGTNLFGGTPFYPSTGVQPGAVGTGLGEGTDSSSKGLTVTTGTRPVDYTSFLNTNALSGKTLIVPSSIVRFGASDTSKAYDGTVNTLVYDNFQKQLDTLRAQGAKVVVADIPAEVLYFNTIGRASGTPASGIPGGGATTTGFVDRTTGAAIPYPTTTTGGTTPSTAFNNYAAAYYYEKQIEGYNDPTIKNLRDFATALKNGRDAGSGSPYSTLSSAYSNINTLAGYYEQGLAKGFGDADGDGQPDNPDAIKALAAFATVRQEYIDDWLTENGYDAIVAPTMGSVAPLVNSALRSPGVTDPYSNGTASLIGRFEGNILGLPSLSVPSGAVGDGTLMTGIQFEGRFDSEAFLLGLGYSYEQATHYRFAPDLSTAPEPASLAMLSIGAVGLLRRRRTA